MTPQSQYAPSVAGIESEPAPQNFFSRLIGVLFSPGETFAEIARAPRVLIPMVLMMILFAANSYLLTERVGHENMVKKQMGMAVKMGMPQERVDEAISEATKPGAATRAKIQGAVIAAVMLAVMLLIVAGVFKLFALLMGADNTFKAVLSAVSYAFVAVGLVHFIVFVVSIYLKPPEEVLNDMQNPVSSNVGAILGIAGVELSKFVTALLSWIDVFGIWRIILLSIGCAAVTRKMSAGTASVPHIALYVFGALLGAVFASFMG